MYYSKLEIGNCMPAYAIKTQNKMISITFTKHIQYVAIVINDNEYCIYKITSTRLKEQGIYKLQQSDGWFYPIFSLNHEDNLSVIYSYHVALLG